MTAFLLLSLQISVGIGQEDQEALLLLAFSASKSVVVPLGCEARFLLVDSRFGWKLGCDDKMGCLVFLVVRI